MSTRKKLADLEARAARLAKERQKVLVRLRSIHSFQPSAGGRHARHARHSGGLETLTRKLSWTLDKIARLRAAEDEALKEWWGGVRTGQPAFDAAKQAERQQRQLARYRALRDRVAETLGRSPSAHRGLQLFATWGRLEGIVNNLELAALPAPVTPVMPPVVVRDDDVPFVFHLGELSWELDPHGDVVGPMTTEVAPGDERGRTRLPAVPRRHPGVRTYRERVGKQWEWVVSVPDDWFCGVRPDEAPGGAFANLAEAIADALVPYVWGRGGLATRRVPVRLRAPEVRLDIQVTPQDLMELVECLPVERAIAMAHVLVRDLPGTEPEMMARWLPIVWGGTFDDLQASKVERDAWVRAGVKGDNPTRIRSQAIAERSVESHGVRTALWAWGPPGTRENGSSTEGRRQALAELILDLLVDQGVLVRCGHVAPGGKGAGRGRPKACSRLCPHPKYILAEPRRDGGLKIWHCGVRGGCPCRNERIRPTRRSRSRPSSPRCSAGMR